jgi:hypothetical protein
MLRVFAAVAAIVIMFVVWLPLEFVRANVTAGLPLTIQIPSMAGPVLIAGAVALGRYRATARLGPRLQRRGFPIEPSIKPETLPDERTM